jgi:hypothetical protein
LRAAFTVDTAQFWNRFVKFCAFLLLYRPFSSPQPSDKQSNMRSFRHSRASFRHSYLLSSFSASIMSFPRPNDKFPQETHIVRESGNPKNVKTSVIARIKSEAIYFNMGQR